MPVEPWIPLAGRPLQLPSIGEQLNLRDYAQQMQIRNQVQALQSQPGMFEGGLATDRYLIALNQIDRSLGQAETMKRAQQLNYMSLERQRAAAEKEKIEGMRQDALDDVWGVGLRRAYASGNPDDMYKYVDEQLEEWDKSGKAKDLRMTPEMIQAARQRRGMDDVQTILLSHGKKDTVEDIKYSADLAAEKKANRKVMEYQGKPVEGISTEGLPLSDVGKPLETRGLTQEPAIEQQALEPEKQHVEPPEPTEQPKEQAKPEDKVYGVREITATKPDTTVEGLYDRAEKLHKMADQATSSKRKKELRDEANQTMQRAEGLDRSINAERRTDIAEQRLKLQEEIAANKDTNKALSPKAVDLLVDMALDGNWQPMTGMARNQTAQTQIRNRFASRAEERGLTHQQINAALTQFHGMQQEARTLGSRAAQMEIPSQELKQFIPLAEQAMAKVPRSNFVPINKLMQMGQNQWSPDQAAFVAANRSVINAFAQVASRGVPTVHNTEEAEKMLSTAQTHAQYRAVLKQLWKETEGGRKAIKAARETLQGEVSGKPFEEAPYPGAPDEPEQGRFPKAKGMASPVGPQPGMKSKGGFTRDEIEAEMKRRGLR